MESSLQPAVNSVSISPIVNNISTSNSRFYKFYLWFSRLGHANAIHVNFMLNLCNIHLSNKYCVELCKPYYPEKFRRLHDPLCKIANNNPYRVSHTDLWGPSPNPYSGGFFYYIEFVDLHTKYEMLFDAVRRPYRHTIIHL